MKGLGRVSAHFLYLCLVLMLLLNLLILEREEGERDMDLLFHLFVHSLVDLCMCPDWGSNLQPCHIRMTL